MKINIKIIRTKTLTIDIESSDTIFNLKTKIQEKEGFPANVQKLIFNGKLLEDGKTLDDYDIKKESSLFLVFRQSYGFCYIIYGEGKELKIDGFCSHCSNTLFLKEVIEYKLGIDIAHQELKINGKIMNDNDSLNTYDIFQGDEVELNIKINLEEYMKLKNSK